MLDDRMRTTLERAVLTVTRQDGLWRVDLDGDQFGHSSDKEVAKAAANRRVRVMADKGQACQVRVHGENGFWSA